MESCFLGQSTQLPLYAYAIMQKEPKEQYEYTLGGEFAGFAIQKSFFKSLKDAYINSEGKLKDTTLKSHFKFHGVYLNNDDFILGYDPHMFNGTKKKKSGMILNEACFTTLDADENLYNKDLESHFNLNDIIQDSINSALHAIHEIEKGHFPIKPIGKNLKSGYNENENNACTYCAYKDICYRKASDFINYKKEIIEHFESNDKKKGGSN